MNKNIEITDGEAVSLVKTSIADTPLPPVDPNSYTEDSVELEVVELDDGVREIRPLVFDKNDSDDNLYDFRPVPVESTRLNGTDGSDDKNPKALSALVPVVSLTSDAVTEPESETKLNQQTTVSAEKDSTTPKE